MKIILMVLLFIASSANAQIYGLVMINDDSTAAALVLTQESTEGQLTDFYEFLQVQPSMIDDKAERKTIDVLDNGLKITCNKNILHLTGNYLECYIRINKTIETDYVRASIFNIGLEKLALLGIAQPMTKELSGLFKENDNGEFQFGFTIKVDENRTIGLDFQGATYGGATIGFSDIEKI